MSVIVNDSYRVVSRIGAGGGGVVYKAWHTRLKKHIVIKEQNIGLPNNNEAQRNEVEALKNVKNPHLPQVYDFVAEGDSPITIMEYIEGENFDELLESGRKFSHTEVVKWYSQLAFALESLHRQNICHRDIKPANIMLMPNGDICLIDFNSALIGGNPARFVSRSLGYASPEQHELYENTPQPPPLSDNKTEFSYSNKTLFAQPKPQIIPHSAFADATSTPCPLSPVPSYTPSPIPCPLSPIPLGASRPIDWIRSDIYSLGATMYHILTGKRPQDRAEKVTAIKKLGRYDPKLIRIIEKSMRPNPYDRYATAAELSYAIGKIQKRYGRGKRNCSRAMSFSFGE